MESLKERLTIGGLLVVIVASLGFFIYNLVGGGSSHKVDMNKPIYFQCTKCDHVFNMTRKELAELHKDDMMFMEQMQFGNVGLECPKCGEKACFAMVQCPNPECKHRYLPPWAGNPQAMMSPEQPVDICPKCGTDRIKWYRKLYAERRKKRGKK